jgi:hypothetical protein
MDDGSYTGRGYTMNTHCFNHDQQLRLVRILEKAFRIDSSIVPDRDKEKILVSDNSTARFRDIVGPCIHPVMRYKVCNPRNDFG